MDTLIDLQLEEAPLIVKKNQKGDKCGSCNQFIPSMTSGNLVAQLNHQKQNDEKPNMISTINSSSIEAFKKGAVKNNRNRNKEGIQEKMLKSSTSGFFPKVLPDISNNTVNITSYTTNKQNRNSKENSTPLKKVSVNSQATQVKYLDEFSERKLNNMINEELEKEIVRPDMLLRVGNKVYDSYDKKINK